MVKKDAHMTTPLGAQVNNFSNISRGKNYGKELYGNVGRKKFPIRTGMAAIGLFTLGSLLLFVSTKLGLDEEGRGIAFFILGLIAFIPGSYATVQLYGAYKGWKDYNYSQIPSYDDD